MNGVNEIARWDNEKEALMETGCYTDQPQIRGARDSDGVQVPPDPQRQIVINQALNGYVVNVGCKVVVFETREKMLSELDRYFKNPAEIEKEYLEKK